MIYIKQCPSCGKNINYSCKKSLKISIKNDSDCKQCSAIKKGPRNEETKKKISQTLTGRTISKDIVDKITNTLKQKFNTPEYKEKFSKLHMGEKNGMYNQHHDEETKKRISELTKEAMMLPEIKENIKKSHTSKEYRNKISKIHKGKIVSNETRRKMREGVVRRVQKYGIHSRNFNPIACKIIDEYGKENGYKFQHALNGGEYSCAGYMVDGYDKEKNTVIEIDEKQHFNADGTLREKDILRQKEIENEILCKFIRIPFNKNQ